MAYESAADAEQGGFIAEVVAREAAHRRGAECGEQPLLEGAVSTL